VLLGSSALHVDCRAQLVSGVPTVSSRVVVIGNTLLAATLWSGTHFDVNVWRLTVVTKRVRRLDVHAYTAVVIVLY